MSVTATGNGLLDILNAVAELSQNEVLVGVPHGETRSDSDMTNAQIGYILETGSPAINLPPRPHLIRGIEEAQDQIGLQLKNAALAALDGNNTKMHRHLGIAGMRALSSVRKTINEGDFAALSPATIAARKKRGRKSTKPLVDTAQYRNSHTYIIMNGKEELERAKS